MAAEGQSAEQAGIGGKRESGQTQDKPPIEPVGYRTAEKTKEKVRRSPQRYAQAHDKRRIGPIQEQPAEDNRLSDVCATSEEASEPKSAKLPVADRKTGDLLPANRLDPKDSHRCAMVACQSAPSTMSEPPEIELQEPEHAHGR